MAFHEGGHALVSLYTAGAHPLHKATIIPRGTAGGMTMFLPDDSRTLTSRKQLMAQLDVSLGGRVAEELVFGEAETTTGAWDDLRKATQVTGGAGRWGMGPWRGVGWRCWLGWEGG